MLTREQYSDMCHIAGRIIGAVQQVAAKGRADEEAAYKDVQRIVAKAHDVLDGDPSWGDAKKYLKIVLQECLKILESQP